MAAPMLAKNSISKKLVRNLVFCNTLTVLILFFLLWFLYQETGHFSLLGNSTAAVKLLVLSLFIVQTVVHFVLEPQRPKFKLTRHVKDLLRCFGVFVVSILVFHGLAVLFGAPFTQQTAETFHFAMLLASAAVGPLLIHLETNTDTLFRVIVMHSAEPGLELTALLSCIGSILGAWTGAVPIPLDWDRPWQVWPITCVIGTMIGHCIGIILSTTHTCIQFFIANKFKIT